MSKRADGAAAARDDDDASPSGKSDDDEGSSGDGEPSSPLEPSEAFKRPRLASDARKPIQTRAREPRPLIWRDTAEETDAPPIAPRRPRRQPRAASPPPEASEAPTPGSNARTLDDLAAMPSQLLTVRQSDALASSSALLPEMLKQQHPPPGIERAAAASDAEAPEASEASEAPTPSTPPRTLDDLAAASPSPPPPAPAAAPAAPPAAEATPTDAAAGAMARSAS